MNKANRVLFGLHLFVGIGAVFGGMAAILNTDDPFGMPAELLQYSPFDNYLIPGIILFTVIGLGNIFSALSFWLKTKYQGYISSVFSWALVIFIVVQCIMLQMVHFAHVLYIFFGVVKVALSTAILVEHSQFPANLVIKARQKSRKID